MKGLSELIDALDATVAISVAPTWCDQHPLAKERVKQRNRAGRALRDMGGSVRWPDETETNDALLSVVLPEYPELKLREWAAPNRWFLQQARMLDVHPEDVAYLPSQPGGFSNEGALRASVLDVLDCSGSRYVLLLGAEAARWFRIDLPLRDLRGRLHLWNNRFYVWVMEAPAAVMRARANGTPFDGEWRDRLMQFVEHVHANDTPLELLANSCVKHGCEEAAWFYDRDAIAWCRKHQRDGERGRAKTRAHWGQQIDGQQTLGVGA